MASLEFNSGGLVPVTILTGFLGSGKTTLLNHILSATHGKKIAVIENEFGEVGIDDALLQKNMKAKMDEDLVEMMNGCICCTVRSDLVEVLKKLAARARGGLKLDAIIIETTGMADPAPVAQVHVGLKEASVHNRSAGFLRSDFPPFFPLIYPAHQNILYAQTFFVDPDVSAFCKLDGIVTLVDAKHIEAHLDEVKPEGAENESVEQIAFADRVLLNKIDVLPNEEDLARVEARIRALNKFAPIFRCERSNVDVKDVLNLKAFDLQRTLELDPEFLNTDGEHVHDQTVTSVGIYTTESVDKAALERWVETLLREKGTDLYRMKGVLSVAFSELRFVYQVRGS